MNHPDLAPGWHQCIACGAVFHNRFGFRRHRVESRCVPIADLLAQGWTRSPLGVLREPRAKRGRCA